MITRIAIAGLLAACGTALGQTVYTAADTVHVVQFLENSAVEITDQNGDCLISDIDVIFMINQRLIDQYGDTFNVGDLDGDGLASTGNDLQVAINWVLMEGFGDADHDGVVSAQDVTLVGQWVSTGQVRGDINFDGQSDIFDTAAANTQVGEQIPLNSLGMSANRIFIGLGQLHEEGTAAWMASGCMIAEHVLGVSRTWKDQPSWWSPNHLNVISHSYIPKVHDGGLSRRVPSGEEHATDVSKSWPANHFYAASLTWKPPQDHRWAASYVGNPSPSEHGYDLSATWPAGHKAVSSETWNEFVAHEETVSRTWWPNHNMSNSDMHVAPPGHQDDVSETWAHATESSTGDWPPNHIPTVSDGWSLGHDTGRSSIYPPNHVADASNTWLGPIYNWPPSHSAAISNTWGEPSPGSWPVFPPDHDWLTSFSDIRDLIDPPSPWPDPWPW